MSCLNIIAHTPRRLYDVIAGVVVEIIPVGIMHTLRQLCIDPTITKVHERAEVFGETESLEKVFIHNLR